MAKTKKGGFFGSPMTKKPAKPGMSCGGGKMGK